VDESHGPLTTGAAARRLHAADVGGVPMFWLMFFTIVIVVAISLAITHRT
jgi:hypothetical protein